ncbi:chorismate synthase [Haliovirga abyssi]|uniref:Chorismate synthase n=1 Tax=Haliovirga abyssi TaxID=2996794 RepID=A0AAU9E1F3_9FUSO|nr:chorismate synthase [Haliovirga abyssi]BDU50205.1 chorismate synthase [Haliovirga abyssi]
MLRYLMAGESHGKALTAILDGLPAGLEILEEDINKDLARRQKGYGRGDRMKIETDKVEILNGVRWKKSLGDPITLMIRNKDWENWSMKMSSGEDYFESMKDIIITKPRPGHADLTGYIKYNQYDVRNILEFASARNSAIRVAIGAVCKKFLSEFGVEIFSYVTEIGGIEADYKNMSYDEILNNIDEDMLKTPDKSAEKIMIEKIRKAKKDGDTVGGVFEVVARNLPIGLGTYTQWDKRLDGNLAASLMSIQAIKGVEIGMGFETAKKLGSEVHDEIFYSEDEKFYRKTNRAGGLEGGMSNGEDIVVRAAMKPIPTLYTPLNSVDIETKEPFEASVERSDASAVPAASVIGEAVVAYELAKSFIEKFGGDSMEEIKRNYESYKNYVKNI